MDLIEVNIDGSISGPIELSEMASSICDSLVSMYQQKGFEVPWVGYLASKNGEFVGTCAFKSTPVENTVEIAYFTFTEFENQGIATEMASRLIKIAQARNPAIRLSAQTLPEENASTAILKKLNFRYNGEINHPEDGLVWNWLL